MDLSVPGGCGRIVQFRISGGVRGAEKPCREDSGDGAEELSGVQRGAQAHEIPALLHSCVGQADTADIADEVFHRVTSISTRIYQNEDVYTCNILIFSILSSTPPHELPLYEPKMIAFVIYYKYLCHCSIVETLTLLLKPARATASPFPEGRDLG